MVLCWESQAVISQERDDIKGELHQFLASKVVHARQSERCWRILGLDGHWSRSLGSCFLAQGTVQKYMDSHSIRDSH